MKEQKNLLIVLGEWWEGRQAAASTPPAGATPGRRRRAWSWFLPNGGTLLLVAILLLTQNVWARSVANPAAPGPSATTVNYQGRLADSGGTALDGTYGMSFSLWDAATDGNLIWGPESHAAVPVSDGLFSVGLGSQTSGGIPTTTWNGDRYLEITVGGETLSPRELIRSVPIAGMALTVPDESIGTAQIADGAVTQDKAPTLVAGQTSDQQIRVGQPVITTDGSGEAWVSLGTSFSNDIYNFVAINGDYGADGGLGFTVHRARGGQDKTGFTVRLIRDDGTILANRTVRIYYIAVGN
jgi:hypothetical protein